MTTLLISLIVITVGLTFVLFKTFIIGNNLAKIVAETSEKKVADLEKKKAMPITTKIVSKKS